MSRKAAVLALLALLGILSGCVGTPPATSGGTDQNCENIRSLAFYKAHDFHSWEADKLRIGYETSGPTEILFVAYENDTVLGMNYVTSRQAMASDGDYVPLDRPLSGNHTVQVRAYGDENGNGKFDPQTDTRCSAQTKPLSQNFSSLNETTTST